MAIDTIHIPAEFDSLEDGRTLLYGFQSLLPQVLRALHIDPLVGVTDTDLLLRDLKYTVRRRKLTNMMLAARTGLLRLFATTVVRDEMEEKIGLLATVMQWDPTLAREVWETLYAPWINFIDVFGLPPAASEVIETYVLDPKDGPTAQLATLLDPDFVFSCDHHHLGGYDVVGEDWVAVTVACRNKFVRDLVFMEIVTGGTLVCGISEALVRQAVHTIVGLDKRILLGLTIGAGLAVAHPVTREWLCRRGHRLWGRTTQVTRTILPPIMANWMAMENTSARAARVLEARRRPSSHPRRIRDYATAILARSAGSLKLGELLHQIKARGYRRKGIGTGDYLARVLRSSPQIFQQDPHGNWSLAVNALTRASQRRPLSLGCIVEIRA